MIDESGNIKWPSVFSLYGTTLLGMFITESFVFSFQIGDGDISVVTKDEVAPLVEPEKFLGTETHSLSKPDAWRKAVIAFPFFESWPSLCIESDNFFVI